MKRQPDPDSLYGAVTDDFLTLLKDFMEEVTLVSRHLKSHNNQPWRRIYIRSAFASLECTIAYLKAHILVVRKFDPLGLSRSQLRALKEFYTSTKKRGQVRRVFVHPAFLKDVIFALELFAYACYVPKRVNTSSTGWLALKKFVAIRNRITHPKKPRHIKVSDAEFRSSMTGIKWFFDTVSEFQRESLDNLDKQLRGMERAVKRMRRAERRKMKNVQNNFT